MCIIILQVTRIFGALVRGALCIFSSKKGTGTVGHTGDALPEDCQIVLHDPAYSSEADDWSNPLFLRLDVPTKSVKCMTFVGSDQLWCGCGNGIAVVDIVNMRVLRQIPVFVKNMALVNEVVSDGNAVWGVGLHLSCVLQWDIKTYSLVSVFDCSSVDPTGHVVTTDPREFEDIFDPERVKRTSVQYKMKEEARGSELDVKNEPEYGMSRFTKSLHRWKSLPSTGPSSLSRQSSDVSLHPPSTPSPQLRRSTQTTSLVILDSTLWIGRGMGDVIILDISRGPTHGKVLARLATEGCEMYGNKSYHKLALVAGEYVVSSQWLEPIDQTSESSRNPHHEVIVWDGWSHKKIEEYNSIKGAMA